MNRRCLHSILLALTAVFVPAEPAAAADLSRIGLAGEAARTARRLAAADELAAQQKWTEAVDEYQRILTEAGDDLVPLDTAHSLQARRVCHLRLAALPPAALDLYRSRVDSQARKWLEQGTTNHDSTLLRRLVDELFCSRYTDQALELLGDLAFERGDFEEAERWWKMLAVPASVPSSHRPVLLFPDAKIDLARVRAKQILARLFRGERTGLGEEIAAFRAQHATAAGQFAGQEGVYADILQKLAAEPPQMLLGPAMERSWPTFGGNPSRNLIVPKPPGRWAQLRRLDGPQWTVRLDAEGLAPGAARDEESASKVFTPFRAGRSLAFHPVIHGDRVFVADARRILGYTLLDGRLIFRYPLAHHVAEEEGQRLRLKVDLPAEPDLAYTLSVADNRIYARLGAQALGSPRKGGAGDTNHAYLVCLDLQFDVSDRVERWKVASKGTGATGPVFEGAPVVGAGGVFIAESRFAGGQTQTAIACYDASTGKLRWQSDVCSVVQDFKQDEIRPRYRHHLVTLAGSTLVYCSHSGAIVGVDALTGRRLWGVRYPTRVPQTAFGEAVPRDLVPCLYGGCRLYVAPLDSDRIFCLDPDTGRTIWESGPVQVLQLLGVAKGRLIFTSTSPRPCIRALEAASGKDLRGWLHPADGSELKTFGRGILAGDWVFWPIRADRRQGVYVLDQETGEPVLFDERINGNLAVGSGCLAVAGARELSVYVPQGRLLQRRREETAQPHASTHALYRLALAEADAGLYTEALADLDRLERRIGLTDRLNGVPLRNLVAARLHDILLDAAEQAAREKRWQQAANFIRQAAGDKFPLFARLTALTREAALWNSAGKPERAITVWQSILENPEFGRGLIVSADGNPHAAAAFASEQIAELIRTQGPAIYAEVEQRGRALLATAKDANRTQMLDRLGREFPNAAITGPALLELGQINEQAGQFGAAARAYRSFLRRAGQEAERPRALKGLARAYERQSCWSAARSTWQQLVAEEGDHSVAGIDPERPVRVFVAEQLQKAEYQSASDVHPPKLSLPLARTWASFEEPAEIEPGEQFVPAAGGRWLCAGNEYLFSVRDRRIVCRGGLTGKLYWQTALPQQPRWIGCSADVVVAAGADSLFGLSRADGVLIWSLSLAADYRPPDLEAFQIAGPFCFFLLDERRLIAVDVFSGRLLWASWAPAGRFHLPSTGGRFRPSYEAGEETVLIQTSADNWLLLDSRTGRRLRESDRPGQAWTRPPRRLDGYHICLLTEPDQVSAVDSRTGALLWKYAVENPGSLTGEALQISGNRNIALVLVCRNYGYYLECLDAQSGRRRWSKPLYFGTQPTDLQGGILDDTVVYLVQNNMLLAHGLADGRHLWKRALPIQSVVETPHSKSMFHWQVLRPQDFLMAFPRVGHTVQWQLHWLFATAQLRLSWPPGDSLPLLVYDPQTGRLVQRLNLPVAAPRLALCWSYHPVLAVVPRLNHRPLTLEEREPAVQISEHGMMIEWEGEAWALNSAFALFDKEP